MCDAPLLVIDSLVVTHISPQSTLRPQKDTKGFSCVLCGER